MRLLDRHTVPVWMLADSLLAVCGLGIVCVAGLISQPTSVELQTHNARLVDKTKAVELAMARKAQELAAQETEHAQTLVRLNAEMAALKKYQDEAVVWIDWAKNQIEQHQQQSAQELKLRQELLNLRGDFTRVIFLVDISGSMGVKPNKEMPRPNWGTDGLPWTYVQNQVTSWLQNLPVHSFRIVCFNRDITEFPSVDESWINGDLAKRRAADFLKQIQPIGFTYTEQALQRALAWKPTAIVLFTDGAPSNDKGELDPAQQQRILELLNKQTEPIPVNVIAVSNYFNEELSSFLHAIASKTGGGFVGL